MGTLILIVLFFMAIFIAAWIVNEVGKRNAIRAKMYNRLYDLIKKDLLKPVNDHNYDVIMYRLDMLGQLRHKDKERTHVLSCEFCKLYEPIRLERLSMDEHSPEAIFG